MEKCRDYCTENNTRDEIFRMVQGENDPLEDFEEIFQLSYKRAHNCTIDYYSLKLVLIRGVREEYVDTLNLLDNGDIY